MISRFVVLIALLLAACAGSPPGPSPGTSSAPPPAARIGTLAVALDTSGPSIGLGLACTEEVPPVCEGATPWKTFDRPGTEGRACIDPGPNPCWSADGSFHFASVNPGYPIISAQTFQGKLSLEADISATCTDRFAQTNFFDAFYHRHVHDIHDANSTNDQRNTRDRHK